MAFPVPVSPVSNEDVQKAPATLSSVPESVKPVDSEAKVVQLIPTEAGAVSNDGGDNEPPRPPSGGSRPSLKRVK